MKTCKHCNNIFDTKDKPAGWMANHSRWCTDNPKRSQYTIDSAKSRAGITKQSLIKRAAGIKNAWAAGKYNDMGSKQYATKIKNGTLNHTIESKEKISQAALKSKHRRLIRSVREYVKADGSKVMLDSSWEEALAKRLDELKIEWIRPELPIQYLTPDGKTHNYFPDFYLLKYDMFLDPKNPYALRVQKEKIDIIKSIMNNLIIIETLEECQSFNIK